MKTNAENFVTAVEESDYSKLFDEQQISDIISVLDFTKPVADFNAILETTLNNTGEALEKFNNAFDTLLNGKEKVKDVDEHGNVTFEDDEITTGIA